MFYFSLAKTLFFKGKGETGNVEKHKQEYIENKKGCGTKTAECGKSKTSTASGGLHLAWWHRRRIR